MQGGRFAADCRAGASKDVGEGGASLIMNPAMTSPALPIIKINSDASASNSQRTQRQRRVLGGCLADNRANDKLRDFEIFSITTGNPTLLR